MLVAVQPPSSSSGDTPPPPDPARDWCAVGLAPQSPGGHLAILDGWRAVSILLVLAGHLLPLGPKALDLNAAAAATGMALFFILSGFLITRALIGRMDLRVFLIRRAARILPLAWTVMAILLITDRSPGAAWTANLFFFSNLPPDHLVTGGHHLWSLCVEMQFYVGIALYVALAKPRALIALPAFALAVTFARIVAHQPISIVTWHRVDEILAGGVLALVHSGAYGERSQRLLARLQPLWLFPILVASAHPAFGALQYARPYLAALTIGASLYAMPVAARRLFAHRATAYVAATSYAVYVLHGALADGWLGSGPTLVKYAKRPLLIAATFGLAHLSTFGIEHRITSIAKRLTGGGAGTGAAGRRTALIMSGPDGRAP